MQQKSLQVHLFLWLVCWRAMANILWVFLPIVPLLIALNSRIGGHCMKENLQPRNLSFVSFLTNVVTSVIGSYIIMLPMML